MQPLYSINWQNNWPCVVNSNLLLIKKCDYNIATNKKIKLKIDNTINHTISTENRSVIEPSTSSHTAETFDITKHCTMRPHWILICLAFVRPSTVAVTLQKILVRTQTTRSSLTLAVLSWSQTPERVQGPGSRRRKFPKQVIASYQGRSPPICILNLKK